MNWGQNDHKVESMLEKLIFPFSWTFTTSDNIYSVVQWKTNANDTKFMSAVAGEIIAVTEGKALHLHNQEFWKVNI